ncbi:MAG: hypothetical protein D6714_00225 [Bacteroidetes bacterium]|nr:MAG: hypothetical protein D6714_00225 [Bacteroidota bacterium]
MKEFVFWKIRIRKKGKKLYRSYGGTVCGGVQLRTPVNRHVNRAALGTRPRRCFARRKEWRALIVATSYRFLFRAVEDLLTEFLL